MADIDLGSLTAAEGVRIIGDAAIDQAGWSVALAGDINGDGFDDFIVGAQSNDAGGANAGAAYVIYGKAGGLADIDLTTFSATDGFRIIGDAAGDSAGSSVASAGDINGDGFDDIIVGAFGSDAGGFNAGAAYVIYGKASGLADIDLATLDPADGFRIIGDADHDLAGYSVSSAGDVNGDGFDDIIIGAQSNDAGGYGAGAAYVIYGKASGFADVDLATLSATDGFRIIGEGASDRAGSSVSSAGDINGDGFDDIIIGAQYAGDTYAGAAYVIYGKAGGLADIDLATLGPADGFRIVGEGVYDQAGVSVSAAGDINGDGFDDIIIGVKYGSDNDAGAAYVIYGKAGGLADIDLATLSATDGFRIIGDAAIDAAGFSVSSAGDVNGDGFDDVIIGARYSDAGGDTSGAAYVIYGKAGGISIVDLGTLTDADGFKIVGAFGDLAGSSVSAAGDVNGDGFDDVMVGAPMNDAGGSNAGAAFIVYGQAPAEGVVRSGNDLGQSIRGGEFDDTLDGRGGDDSLFGAGGDDVLVGATGNDLLVGGSGNDYLSGGAGTDTVSYESESAGVTVSLALTGAQDTGSAGVDILSGIENLTGSAFGDTLTGSSGANLIVGLAGNDSLDGGAGDDTLIGGIGDDTYYVDSTGDIITEEAGEGTDTVRSSITWTLGADLEKLFLTGTGPVNGTGNALANVIVGNSAGNSLDGLDGDDALRGAAGDDTLNGGAGNDRLNGGSGADAMAGGTGDDLYYVDNAGDTITENAGEGTDTVRSSIGWTLGASVEKLMLTGSGAIDGTGNELANTIIGNSAANMLAGEDGDDNLIGGAGDDTLDGGAGTDRMTGGSGNDTYVVDSSTDRIIEKAGEGSDSVNSSASFTLIGNIENLQLTGSADIDGIGNALDNVIQGNSGANILSGGSGGADQIFGGGGDDTLKGGTGNDWIDGGAGRDVAFGGADADTFVFRDGDFAGLTATTCDKINDFSQAQSDSIDLALVDADTLTGGDQAFAFIGTAAFTNTAGELRYEIVSGSTYVYGDTNGDGAADFMIRLIGSHGLTSGDFVI